MNEQARLAFPFNDGAVDLDLLQRQVELLHDPPGFAPVMAEQLEADQIVIFVYAAKRYRFNLAAGKT